MVSSSLIVISLLSPRIGTSLTGSTVISNCCDTVSNPSETLTVIIELPFAFAIGENKSEYSPPLTEMSSLDKLGTKAVLLDNASTVKSSSSASVGLIWITILPLSSSIELGSSIDDNTGASFIFTTLNVNWDISESRLPSFATILISANPE